MTTNRIHGVPLTEQAITDIVVALRHRANSLHHLADDAVSPHVRRHYREVGGRYERLARFMSEEADKAAGRPSLPPLASFASEMGDALLPKKGGAR